MIVITIVLGLVVGQLLNLFLERFYSDSSLIGRAMLCPACGTAASPIDLLPGVGYVARLGRCPSCGRLLSPGAVLLPAGCAGLFALGYVAQDEQLGAGLLAGASCSVFLALVFTDMDRRVIPNRLTYPAIAAAAVLAWGWTDRSIGSVFAGGAAALAIGLLLWVVARGGFGFGDVKMLTLMGLTSGFPYFVIGLIVMAFVGGVVSVLLLVTRIRGRKDFIPYGPFIAVGAIVATLWGPALWG